jgi:hypothetical protein
VVGPELAVQQQQVQQVLVVRLRDAFRLMARLRLMVQQRALGQQVQEQQERVDFQAFGVAHQVRAVQALRIQIRLQLRVVQEAVSTMSVHW